MCVRSSKIRNVVDFSKSNFIIIVEGRMTEGMVISGNVLFIYCGQGICGH